MLFFQNHLIIRAITMTTLAIGLLNLVESHTDNTIASAFGWFLAAAAIVLYSEDVVGAIDQRIPLSTSAAVVICGLAPATVGYLAIRNLVAGGILVPAVLGIVALYACKAWYYNVRSTGVYYNLGRYSEV